MIELRKVQPADKAALCEVEALSTPGLRYVPDVFEQFEQDPRGEFSLAQIAGEVVGCAKLTALPDGSAWLETLRVKPQHQGLGVGKALYQRFFEVAQREGIQTMRMYTGIENAASKGLAERFGFSLEETFLGYSHRVPEQVPPGPPFEPLRDPQAATERLMAQQGAWGDFVVMNRTFYRLTPALCAYLAQQGMVYAQGANLVVLGARFSPEKALHLGLFAGNAAACIGFAQQQAVAAKVPLLHCLFPQSKTHTQAALSAHGFEPNPSPFIVMRV